VVEKAGGEDSGSCESSCDGKVSTPGKGKPVASSQSIHTVSAAEVSSCQDAANNSSSRSSSSDVSSSSGISSVAISTPVRCGKKISSRSSSGSTTDSASTFSSNHFKNDDDDASIDEDEGCFEAKDVHQPAGAADEADAMAVAAPNEHDSADENENQNDDDGEKETTYFSTFFVGLSFAPGLQAVDLNPSMQVCTGHSIKSFFVALSWTVLGNREAHYDILNVLVTGLGIPVSGEPLCCSEARHDSQHIGKSA
jgi:hypothetical protein